MDDTKLEAFGRFQSCAVRACPKVGRHSHCTDFLIEANRHFISGTVKFGVQGLFPLSFTVERKGAGFGGGTPKKFAGSKLATLQ